MPSTTSTGLTRLGIAADCNAFVRANAGDICYDTALKYGITLAQLTMWNTVLGYPDGKNCSTQFWTGYDYCVGVSGTVTTSPVVNGPSAPGEIAVIAGKNWISLAGDMSPSAYVVGDIDCVTPDTEFYQACWQKLDINPWLTEWYIKEPRCQSRQNQRGCNIHFNDEIEAWTTTFIREYVGAGGADCTLLPGNCVFDPDPNRGADIPALARARYRYVHFSIHAVHKFFNDWRQAVQDALTTAANLITAIVDFIDRRKPKKTNVALNVVATVLGVGLAIIPGLGPIAGVSAGALVAANVGLAALKQAPTVAKSIWPVVPGAPPQQAEADSTTVQSLSVKEILRMHLQNGLQLVQGVGQEDVSAFLAFAGNGSFSISQREMQPPSIASITGDKIQPLLLAYTTFLVSTTLAQNGWHAILLPGVNPEGITNRKTPYPAWAGDHQEKDDLECTDYDKYGRCSGKYWWYSETQNSAYALRNDKSDDSTEYLQTFFDYGWSTGQLLFENAAVCEIQSILRSISTIDNASVTYTTVKGKAGFQFDGPLPGLAPDDFSVINQMTQTYFLPFDGAGLTHLRQQAAYANLFHHPANSGLWEFTNQGIDFACISQLDVAIATTWGGSWTS
ncbi:MAG: hypothetical protein Q9184_002228 [Pyrenodesmia sp. 2 TL-2023]